MANTLLLKRSSTSSNTPDANELSYGELALNYNDGKLFFKNTSDVVQELLTSPGTSSGQVLFTNSSGSIAGENNLWWNADDNKLGIGTNAPSEVLTLDSSSNTRLLLKEDGSSKGTISAGGGGLYIANKAGDIIFRNSSDDDTVRIKNDGKVGIGTTSPGAKLDVVGGDWNTSLTIKGGSSTSGIKFLDSDNNVDGYIYASNGKIGFMDPGGDFGISIQDDTYIDFAIGAGVSRMRIKSDGKVGINNTTPQRKLDVNNGGTGISAHFGGYTSTTNGVIGGISFGYFEAGNVNYRKAGIIQEQIGDSSARGHLHLLVDTAADGGSANAGDAKLTIHGTSGNVGIGNTSPSAVLHVDTGDVADDTIEDVVILEGSIGGPGTEGLGIAFSHNGSNHMARIAGTYHNSTSALQGNLDFYTGYSTPSLNMRIDATGNVGIGASSPDTKLHILESSAAPALTIDQSTQQQYSGLRIRTNRGDAGSYDSNWDIFDSGGDNLRFSYGLVSPSTYGNLGADGTIRMVIDGSSGNVGIGTSSPSSPAGVGTFLHIADSSHAGIVLEDTGSTSWDIYSADGHLYFYDESTSANKIIFSAGGDVKVATHLAVGTTFSDNHLGSKSIHTVGYIDITGNGGLTFNDNASTGYFYSDNQARISAGNNIMFQAYDGSSYVERMRILTSGEVGIGTSSPDVKLHVEDASAAAFLQIEGTNSNVAANLRFIHNGGGSRTNYDGNWNISRGSSETNFGGAMGAVGGLAFWHQTAGGSYVDALRIKDDGDLIAAYKVGIGKTSGLSKTLHVDSTVGDASTPNGIMLANYIHGSDSQIYMYAENDSGTQSSGIIKYDPDALKMTIAGSNGTGMSIDSSGDAEFAGGITIEGGHTITNSGGDLTLESIGDDINIKGSWLRIRNSSNTVKSAFHMEGNLTLGADAQTTHMLKVDSGTSYFAGTIFRTATNNSAGQAWTVVGDGNIPHISIQNSGTTNDNMAGLFFKDDQAHRAGIHAKFTNHTDSSEASQLIFSTATGGNTREKMVLDEDGKLGIGTSSPSGYKVVVHNSSEDMLKLHNTTDGLDSLISFTNAGGTLARIQGLDNGGLQFDTGNNAGGINTNAMFISNDAKVGIGTASPSHALSVNGEVRFTLGGSSQVTFNTVGGDGAMYITNSDGDSKVNFDTEGDSYLNGGNTGIGTTSFGTSSGSSSYKQFKIYDGTVLTDSGGLNSASMLMQNAYVGTSNNNFYLQSSWASRIMQTTGNITFSTASSGTADNQISWSDSFFIKNDGKVGMGTTSPLGNKLHIHVGDSGVDEVTLNSSLVIESNTNNYIQMLNPNGNNSGIIFGEHNNIGIASILHDGGDNSLRFKVASAEVIRINGAGNVGINETSPDEALHITSTAASATPVILLENSNQNNLSPQLNLYNNSASPDDGDYVGQIDFEGNDSGDNRTQYARIIAQSIDVTNTIEDGILDFNVQHNGTLTNGLRIRGMDGGAYIGIGETNPGTILHIKKNDTTGPTITLQNSEYSAYINAWGSVGGGSGRQNRVEINAGTSKDFAVGAATLRFQTGGVGDTNEKMRIDGSGKVGIGTTSPARLLTVSSGSDTYAQIETTAGANDCWLRFVNTGDNTESTNFRIGRTHDGRFDIGAGDGTHHMSVLSTGKVGMNMHDPEYDLHVKNSISVHQTYGANAGGFYFTADDHTSSPEKKQMGRIYSRVTNWGVDDLDASMDFYTAENNAVTGPHMTIDHKGRVGIGDNATDPLDKLHIQSTTNGRHVFGQGYTATRSEPATISLQRVGGTLASPAVIASTGAGSGTVLGNIGGDAYSPGGGGNTFHRACGIKFITDQNFGTNIAPGAVTFYTKPVWADGDVERMRVSSDGNVGIGTTSPNKVSYGANAKVLTVLDEGTAGDYGAIEIGGYRTNDGLVGDLNFFNTDGSGTLQARAIVRGIRDGANDALGISFFTEATGGSCDEKMRITSAGNVGIGTTSPGADLHVGGPEASPGGVAGTVDRLFIQPYSNTGGPYKFKARTVSGASDFLDLYYGSTHIQSWGLNGNVGIGTLSPTQKFYVDNGQGVFNRGNSSGDILEIRGLNTTQAMFSTDGLELKGNFLPSADNSSNLGSISKRWANLYVGDIELSNEGSGGNEVDGTEGKWTIQEGEEDLFLINRKSGKKYKFKIEEMI